MDDIQASGVDDLPTDKTKDITLQSLLSSGAHYGHATEAWCPKMAPYLYGTKSVRDKKFRNTKDVYIFNLDLTIQFWEVARKAIFKNAAAGGSLLFVGTKPQGRAIIEREALRCNSHYICHKWVGGILTNFGTLRQSVAKMDKIEQLLASNADPDSKVSLVKKEALLRQKDLNKLIHKFGGIRTMQQTPTMMFVMDIANNHTAVAEAKALHIPIVGIADSNADPESIDYIIPANDDATGALNLIISNVANAVIAGQNAYQEKLMISNQGSDFIIQPNGEVQEGGGVPNSTAPMSTEDGIPVTVKSASL